VIWGVCILWLTATWKPWTFNCFITLLQPCRIFGAKARTSTHAPLILYTMRHTPCSSSTVLIYFTWWRFVWQWHLSAYPSKTASPGMKHCLVGLQGGDQLGLRWRPRQWQVHQQKSRFVRLQGGPWNKAFPGRSDEAGKVCQPVRWLPELSELAFELPYFSLDP